MKDCEKCGEELTPKNIRVCYKCKKENRIKLSKNLKGRKGLSTPFFLR